MWDWNHVPIFWIVIGIIAVAGIIFRFLEQLSRDRTIRTLAEKGQAIPPELVRGDVQNCCRRRYRGSLRGGLVLMAVGAGLTLMSWQGHSDFGDAHVYWLPGVGAIPFLIGVALVIAGLLERNQPLPPKSE
jgi:peptidoglycan/LPS O-acetylase OafA/YrhL